MNLKYSSGVQGLHTKYYKGYKMQELEYNGAVFKVNENGFLADYESYSDVWVKLVAETEQVEAVTPDHMRVLDVIRGYYAENGIAPMLRILTKATGFEAKYIYQLFPTGPGKGACRMAGLPNATGCI